MREQHEAEMGEAKMVRQKDSSERQRTGIDSERVTGLILGGPGKQREAVTLPPPSESLFTPE